MMSQTQTPFIRIFQPKKEEEHTNVPCGNIVFAFDGMGAEDYATM